jgi:hypothetical protein
MHAAHMRRRDACLLFFHVYPGWEMLQIMQKGIENAMSLRCSTWPDLIVDGNVINTGKS